ncbi:MAG TPA: helix-turn-helix transcriptional regulator [Candidatus Limnocylindrales bacterium]
METTVTRRRRRVVVDQRDLARAIGGRIRAARLTAGMTQQELAGDRYTKAYVSALELGHAKPSMAALDYLAPRLGTTSDRLIADHASRWSRVDADLHLAAGRLPEAAEAYEDLAAGSVDRVSRGELLLGAAEAHCKLNHAQQAAPLLVEAIALLADGGRQADQKRAQYWLSYVHMALDDPEEARRLLLDMLGSDAEATEDPDFEVRVRIALAQVETEHGDPARAALYLEEARELAAGLDLRKRGIYFDALSKARFAANDTEGAIRAATEALALFRASEQEVQEAMLENALAMSFVRLGNLAKAGELAAQAVAIAERLHHFQTLGHYLDTQATISLARGDLADALRLTDRALAIEAEYGPANDQVGARITRAQALTAAGRTVEAEAAWADAAGVARQLSSPLRRRRIFAAWAESLAAQGRHAEAYEVMRQAL